MSKVMTKNKFFYAIPKLFPNWDYPSRSAIGLNLDDFRGKGSPVYRFIVKGKMYSISAEKAEKLGRKYITPFPSKLPHLIPIEEFDVSDYNTGN